MKKYSMSGRLLTVKITVMRIWGLPTYSFWGNAVSMEKKTPKIKFYHKKNTSLVKKSRKLKIIFLFLFLLLFYYQNKAAPGQLSTVPIRVTSHLTIFMHGLLAKSKIQRNNYHHGNGGPSLTGKTPSVSLIFTHGTRRTVRYRWVRSRLKTGKSPRFKLITEVYCHYYKNSFRLPLLQLFLFNYCQGQC